MHDHKSLCYSCNSYVPGEHKKDCGTLKCSRCRRSPGAAITSDGMGEYCYAAADPATNHYLRVVNDGSCAKHKCRLIEICPECTDFYAKIVVSDPEVVHLREMNRVLRTDKEMLLNEIKLQRGMVRNESVGRYESRQQRNAFEHENAELRLALRSMLKSQDCEWENKNMGHDWADVCKEARRVLGIKEG